MHGGYREIRRSLDRVYSGQAPQTMLDVGARHRPGLLRPERANTSARFATLQTVQLR
jgi:hypothetical protein